MVVLSGRNYELLLPRCTKINAAGLQPSSLQPTRNPTSSPWTRRKNLLQPIPYAAGQCTRCSTGKREETLHCGTEQEASATCGKMNQETGVYRSCNSTDLKADKNENKLKWLTSGLVPILTEFLPCLTFRDKHQESTELVARFISLLLYATTPLSSLS